MDKLMGPQGMDGGELFMGQGSGQRIDNDEEDLEQYISLPSLVASAVGLYVLYYLIYAVKKPVLSCNSTLRQFLNTHCPLLEETYWPTIWCLEARFQTVFRGLLQSCPHVPYNREMLSLPDGGELAMDWVHDTKCDNTEPHPVVIILPGLTGSSEESYVRHLVKECIKLGYRSVVLNYRGIGGTELKTSRTYCATKTDDLESAIHCVEKKYPQSQIFAVGVSMGGILLTNYLAHSGKNSHLVAGMAVSAPWNIFESTISLERGINGYMFNRYLCSCLKETVRPHTHMFNGQCDMDSVFKSRTIRDFDERFTVKLFGYKDSHEYYTEACIDRKIHDIKVPLLCLNASDDPFSPGPHIPLEDASISSHVAIVMTSRGGHIAFIDGCFVPYETSYIQRVFSQFSSAVIRQGHEIRPALDSATFPRQPMNVQQISENNQSEKALQLNESCQPTSVQQMD